MTNQLEALGFLKDWSIWLVSLQTGAIGLTLTVGKDRLSNAGRVASVAIDKTRSIKTARLRPAVDFDHLEEAFVVLPAGSGETDDEGSP